MSKKNDKYIFWLAGITVLLLVLLPYMGLLPKFAISEGDFISNGTAPVSVTSIVYDNVSNVSIISYVYNNITYVYPSGQVYYDINGVSSTTLQLPTTAGTYTINKYQITTPDNVTATLDTWYTIYTLNVQNVTTNVTNTVYVNQSVTPDQICLGLGGNYNNSICHCPNNSTWTSNSSTKFCGPVTNTVTVTATPTFWEQYGAATIIFVIMGSIILYLIYKRTR